MFARELARQLAGSGVTVCSLHPGTVYTEITRHLLSGWLIVLKVLSLWVGLILGTALFGRTCRVQSFDSFVEDTF